MYNIINYEIYYEASLRGVAFKMEEDGPQEDSRSQQERNCRLLLRWQAQDVSYFSVGPMTPTMCRSKKVFKRGLE